MARNMITNTNPNHRVGILAFSLEIPRSQYVKRLLAQEARLDNENLRSGKIKEQEFENLCTITAPKLHDQQRTATMLIDDTPGLSLRVMRSKIRSYLRKHPDIRIVMIDYLQLMDAHASKGDTYSQKIGYITRGLKNLTKELKIPIILFSQLSRAVEKRGGDKRPQLSDLRSSGDIEQDADIVIFIYRPEYYDIKSDTYGNKYPEKYAEFIISKQRNGPVGTVPLYFKKEQTLFGNRAHSWAEDTFDTPDKQHQPDDASPF
jgi:replicative DNA helicase